MLELAYIVDSAPPATVKLRNGQFEKNYCFRVGHCTPGFTQFPDQIFSKKSGFCILIFILADNRPCAYAWFLFNCCFLVWHPLSATRPPLRTPHVTPFPPLPWLTSAAKTGIRSVRNRDPNALLFVGWMLQSPFSLAPALACRKTFVYSLGTCMARVRYLYTRTLARSRDCVCMRVHACVGVCWCTHKACACVGVLARVCAVEARWRSQRSLLRAVWASEAVSAHCCRG